MAHWPAGVSAAPAAVCPAAAWRPAWRGQLCCNAADQQTESALCSAFGPTVPPGCIGGRIVRWARIRWTWPTWALPPSPDACLTASAATRDVRAPPHACWQCDPSCGLSCRRRPGCVHAPWSHVERSGASTSLAGKDIRPLVGRPRWCYNFPIPCFVAIKRVGLRSILLRARMAAESRAQN